MKKSSSKKLPPYQGYQNPYRVQRRHTMADPKPDLPVGADDHLNTRANSVAAITEDANSKRSSFTSTRRSSSTKRSLSSSTARSGLISGTRKSFGISVSFPVITEDELASSALYKDRKARINSEEETGFSHTSNGTQTDDDFLAPVQLTDPKYRPLTLPPRSYRRYDKESSCCCYTAMILVVCLASLGIIAALGGVVYLQVFGSTRRALELQKITQQTNLKTALDNGHRQINLNLIVQESEKNANVDHEVISNGHTPEQAIDQRFGDVLDESDSGAYSEYAEGGLMDGESKESNAVFEGFPGNLFAPHETAFRDMVDTSGLDLSQIDHSRNNNFRKMLFQSHMDNDSESSVPDRVDTSDLAMNFFRGNKQSDVLRESTLKDNENSYDDAVPNGPVNLQISNDDLNVFSSTNTPSIRDPDTASIGVKPVSFAINPVPVQFWNQLGSEHDEDLEISLEEMNSKISSSDVMEHLQKLDEVPLTPRASTGVSSHNKWAASNINSENERKAYLQNLRTVMFNN